MADFRFIFRKLAFAGAAKGTRELDFVDGVNVIYGASNSGKSYTIKALDFMCGAGSALPEITELRGYDTCWLEQDLPMTGRVRLSRAVKGGDFEAFVHRLDRVRDTQPARTFSATHSNPNSLSRFLLGELGIVDNKQIASTQNGKKASFTFRHFAAYMFTEETPMMAEWSPIKIAPQSNDTFDKNVLKFILTGDDDSSIVETPKPNEQRISNAGKIEIVEEWIEEAVADLHRSFSEDEVVDKSQVAAQEAALSKALEEQHEKLAKYQTELDELRRQRRHYLEMREEFEERAGEIALTLERFGLLASVYESDVERLEALEEGAAALMAGAGRLCPLCGAEPEHQHEVHGLDHVERSRRAVAAEISKIRAERADLGKATASLKAEREGLGARITRLSGQIAEMEGAIEKLLPLEVTSRESYEALDIARQRLRNVLNLLDRIESLKNRKKELEAFKATGIRRGSVAVGVGGEIGFELAQIAQSILQAWRFPGNPTVSLDDKTHDILIDGKNRRANGKGVRALMNAAFKMSVLVYCQAKDLPHPGIVALDSPLLSYRDPINSRHGALSSDEELVVKSDLKEYFYRYLLELSDITQFIIIENDPPPFDLGPKSMVTLFVGSTGQGGRPGLL